MLPKLTEILQVPRLTNHSIRTTVVQNLIKLGFPEHLIMQITGILIMKLPVPYRIIGSVPNIFLKIVLILGHKSVESLLNYKPKSTLVEREEVSVALQTGTRMNFQEIAAGSSSAAPLNVYECPFNCHEKFKTKSELMEHIDSIHREGNIIAFVRGLIPIKYFILKYFLDEGEESKKLKLESPQPSDDVFNIPTQVPNDGFANELPTLTQGEHTGGDLDALLIRGQQQLSMAIMQAILKRRS